MASEPGQVKRPLPALFTSVALMLLGAIIPHLSSHSKHAIQPPPAAPAPDTCAESTSATRDLAAEARFDQAAVQPDFIAKQVADNCKPSLLKQQLGE